MARASSLLLSSALGLLAWPQIASAQDQSAANSEGAPAGAAVGGPGDEIVVTGIRASVQRAQEIKRDAPSVVEAITVEDLGKFTDRNIADALQRIPGVNIERTPGTFDSGEGVTIRGLGAGFSTSTVNGRELLGTPGFGGDNGRQFNFDTVPPEVLGGVTVYKTSTASQVEPGLAGQVNLQTLRPLDYKIRGGRSVFGSLTGSGVYETKSGKVSPRIGGIVGAKLFGDTLGIYLSGLFSNDRFDRFDMQTYSYRQSFGVRDASGNVTQYTNVLTPGGGHDMWAVHQTTKQRSLAGGLQWKPTSNFELNLDAEYNRTTDQRHDDTIYFYPPSFDGTVADPGGIVVGGTGNGIAAYDTSKIPGAGTGGQLIGALDINYVNKSFNTGANAVWRNDADTLRATLDYSYGRADYFISWKHPYIGNGPLGGNAAVVDLTGFRPAFAFGGPTDLSDPASYTDFSTHEYFQKRYLADRHQVRLDLSAKLGGTLTARIGARYATTTATFVAMAFRPATRPTSTAGLFSGETVSFPFFQQPIPQISFDGFCRANSAFCDQSNKGKGSLDGHFPTSSAGSPEDVFGIISGDSYRLRETNTAVYGQLDFDGRLFGLGASGNVGVRGVRISEKARAFQGSATVSVFVTGPELSNNTQIVEDDNSYWEVLPSANFTLKPADNVNLRASVAKTMSLAPFFALTPHGTAVIPVPSTPGGYADTPTASTGNTQLKPTKAWNYDLTGEYYTSYGGAFIVSAFYKDVRDLIIGTTDIGVTIPGQGSTLFNVSRVDNASKGHTYGAEIGTNQPFTFLPAPWDGFGLTANYTYVVSKTNQSGVSTQFPGSSKHNVNVTAYYEKYGLSARVAYTYRNAYLSSLGTGNEITRAITRVDASVNYAIRPGIELLLTGTNLTGRDHSVYSREGGYDLQFFTEPTRYTAGVRLSF